MKKKKLISYIIMYNKNDDNIFDHASGKYLNLINAII